jgi:adenylate kinase family enzyme
MRQTSVHLVLLALLPLSHAYVLGPPRVGHASLRVCDLSMTGAAAAHHDPLVYFVMGGPGSGKGTQCARLVERFGFVHLSAGDLLRSEVASGSELGLKISAIIDQGQIVASETTVALLRAAMANHAGPFLIDGFPRSLSNLEAFEEQLGSAAFMLFLEVSEPEMEARLLKRGLSSGRSDDNRDTIVKRFRTFLDDSMPVIRALEGRGLIRKVDADAAEDVVFARVCGAFDGEPVVLRDYRTDA